MTLRNMYIKLLLIISFLLVFQSFLNSQSIDYQTIPLPQKVELRTGKPFILDENVVICAKKQLKQNAVFLADYIFENTHIKLKITDSEVSKKSISLHINDTISNKEGYVIQIDSTQINISGKTPAGVFYGIQTLRKSVPVVENTGSIELPQVLITDFPRFEYRGMLLDVSRHFFPVSFIKEYIDILALHQINYFHWHLTDDQGWRIEIKKFPELIKKGSVRAQTVIGRNTDQYDSTRYSGYYKQSEIKEIVAYAGKRFITIVPEIDMPGHFLAALAAYPELGCTGGPYEVATKWGIFDDVLCPGNQKSYRFVEQVLNETMKLFPSKYIHIGGDECPKGKWEKCPKCQQKIAENGIIADSLHSAGQKLQSYFIARVGQYVNKKNRRIIGWDEILEGGLNPDATVMSWRGNESAIESAKQKRQVIMASNSHLYFNYAQTSVDNINVVYNFNPVPPELNPDEQKYIIGVQANLWTEYVTTKERAEYMIIPRIAALSEVQWTNENKKDYNNFLIRAQKLKPIYDVNSYSYAPYLFEK